MAPRSLAAPIESVAAVVLAVAVAWCILSVDFLPSNDGPQHAFAGYVKSHFRDADAGWPAVYEVNDPPTSNGYMDVFVPLEGLFGLQRAHQLTVVAIMLFWAMGWFFWLRGEGGRGSFLALMAFPCALQWGLWIGLYPFVCSSAFIPIALMIRRRWGLTGPIGIVLALMLVGIARIHIFGAALCGLVLVGACLADSRPMRAMVLTVLIGAPSFLYTLWVSAQSTMLSKTGATWDVPYSVVDLFMEFFLPGPRAMQVLVLVVLAGAVVAAIKTDRRRHVFLALGLSLMSVGLLLPLDWSGWELIRPRLLPTAFMLILGAAVIPKRGVVVVAVVVLAVSAWRVQWSARLHAAAAAELKPAIDITSGVDLRGLRWTYVVTDGPVSHVYDDVRLAGTFLHLAQMVAPHVGGAPYFSHDGDGTMHHILAHDERPSPWLGALRQPEYVRGAWDPTTNRRMRELHLSTYFSSLSFLDAVLVYGLPGDGDVLREAGYRVTELKADASGHRLFEGRFEGCSWNIQIDGLKEPTVVVTGFGLAHEMQDAWIVDVAGALRIDGVPCGPAWFSVEAGCREERGADGQVPVRPTNGAQDLHCQAQEAPTEQP